MRIKTGIVLWIKTGNAKMAFVFEIDRLFINYSWLMTYCQSCISRVDRKVIFGGVTNNDMRSKNMTSIFVIDMSFINYSCDDDVLSKNLKNAVLGNFWSESSNMIFIFHIDKFFSNY